MAKMRKWADEKPEPFKKIVVTDINGNSDGHLSAPVMYDGKEVRTNLAHTIHIDRNNIDKWCYLDELYLL